MGSKSYAMMFKVLEGGVTEPINWSADNLDPSKIIMVIDESSLGLYLWYGKANGLVARRTAMRQAQSLKGHGFQVGKSIVGRGLSDIIEIDERKIGRVPADTEANEKFMSVLSRPVVDEGNFVVSFGGEGAAVPASKPKAEPKPEPVKEAPKPEPVKEAPKALVTPQPKVDEKPPIISEYDDNVEVPEPPAPAAAKSSVGGKEEAQMGLVIMAVLSQFNDIWASKKEDGSVSVEQMDGNVCKFSIENGKVKFDSNSFTSIDPSKKDAIKKKFDELVKSL